MRPHATAYVSSCFYMRAQVLDFCCVCVLILLYVHPPRMLLMLLYASTGAGSLRVAWRENLLSSRAHEEHR